MAVIPNRGSPPAILLRQSYRAAGKTRNRTLANRSRWPAERIAQRRAVRRGDKRLPAAAAVAIVRAPPHGHGLAALGSARRIARAAVRPRRAPQRRRDLALALIGARRLEPAATLAPATAGHSRGEMSGSRGAADLTGGQSRALAGGTPQGRPQPRRSGRWRTAPGAPLPLSAR